MSPDPAAPNAQVLDAIVREIRHGGFSTLLLPAPPAVYAEDGAPLPATYCNFYVSNRAVIVPIYDVPSDERALAVLREAFPGREAIGLPARELLSGGGAFHCVTQPQPAVP
jgi:agmatine deiminase